MKSKLNIGCGGDLRVGYVNADRRFTPNVDVVVDLEERLPFKDDEFEETICYNTLQYIHQEKLEHAFKELLRVTKGFVKIRVAHALSGSSVSISKNVHTNLGFLPEDLWKLDYSRRLSNSAWQGNLISNCEVHKVKIRLHVNNWFIIRMIEREVNRRGVRSQKAYARLFISRLFPPKSIELWIKKK